MIKDINNDEYYEYIINLGAQVGTYSENKKYKEIEEILSNNNEYRYYILGYSLRYSCTDVPKFEGLKYLFELGANPNWKDADYNSNYTPLHIFIGEYAEWVNNDAESDPYQESIINLFVQYGADLNIKCNYGLNIIDTANNTDNYQAVKILKKLGAKFSRYYVNEFSTLRQEREVSEDEIIE